MEYSIARPRRARLIAALGVLAIVVTVGGVQTADAAEFECEPPACDIGASVIATGGALTVTLEEKNASDESHLFVIDPDDNSRHFVGSNFDPPGTMVDVTALIGAQDGGTEIIFEIENLGSECMFSTGPAARNPDGIEHAGVVELGNQNGNQAVRVGFEDLFWRGEDGSAPINCPNPAYHGSTNSDRDYNDNVFKMTGLVVNPLPVLLEANPAIVDVLGLTLYFPQLSATLRDGAGNPIGNREIVFTATSTLLGSGEEICRARTDSTGLASCGGLEEEIASILGLGFDASFAGDGLYQAAEDHGPIVAVAPGLEVL